MTKVQPCPTCHEERGPKEFSLDPAGVTCNTCWLAAQDLRCTFCARDRHSVAKLIAGPGVYICDECTETASTQIAASQREGGPEVIDFGAGARGGA